jgi:hypothetical protein
VGPSSAHILDGKKYDELPLNLQERILDTQLITYILDAKAPERARLDIFERVNSGEPLTRQQMRNALYNGPATAWLKDAAASDLFKQATGGSLRTKTMRDREAINRFCAFSLLGWESYKADMDVFLATVLTMMDKMSIKRRLALRKSFDISMKINRELFGKHAFRKSLAAEDPNAGRNILNIALFDVCSVLLAQIGEGILNKKNAAEFIRKAIIDLVLDDDFSVAITYSTNSTKSVANRFKMAEEAFGLR